MDNQDNNKMSVTENPLFAFDSPADMPLMSSSIRVIGVGNCGCNIVDEMFQGDRYSIPDVDAVLVANDAKSLAGKAVEEKRRAVVSAMEAKDIVEKHVYMLFLVADLDEDYSVRMVKELCQQFQKDDREDDWPTKVSVVLSVTPFGFEKEDEGVAKEIAEISKMATKVITVRKDFTGQVTKRVSDIIGTACLLFLKRDWGGVDYMDVATVLQYGSKAIYGMGIGEGPNKVEKAFAELDRNLEQNGCKIENAKGVMLLVRVQHSLSAELRDAILQECFETINLLRYLLIRKVDIFWNAAEDEYDESDTIAIHAILLY